MLRAAVPKASVHHHNHSRPRENQIGSSAKIHLGASIHSVAKPLGVEKTSNGQLRLRVARAVAEHGAARVLGRRPGLTRHRTTLSGGALRVGDGGSG